MRLFAIVGRPNVGKSTFFNRLARRRIAITSKIAGTTRDRNIATTAYKRFRFLLMDTGGFEPEATEAIPSKMREQSQLAVEEADAILFMTDFQAGLTEQDKEIYLYLKRSGKPVYFIVNKIDGDKHEDLMGEFWEAGPDEIYTVSSEHGRGVDYLLDELAIIYPDILEQEQPDEDEELALAIVGRPNAGKSSLVNYLLGQNKQIVDDAEGTTRDPIDNDLIYNKQKIKLIDTAGLRRKSKVSQLIDKYSMAAAVRSVERADVALLMIDATEGVVEQDAKIAGLIVERGKGLVIVVNKWDLVEKDSKSLEKYREDLYDQMEFTRFAPIIFISAKTGKRAPYAIDTALLVFKQCIHRVQTSHMNEVLAIVQTRHIPPSKRGKTNKLLYAAQVAIKPPTFIVHCGDPKAMDESYRRFLLNQFRFHFGFEGTPIQIFWRDRGGKSAEDDKW